MTLTEHTTVGLHGAQRSRLTTIPWTAAALDLAIATLATIVAYVGRLRLPIFDAYSDNSTAVNLVAPVMVLGWLVAIRFCGGYERDIFGAGPDEFKRVVNASLLTAGIVGVGCYLTKIQLSRGFFFLAFTLGLVSLIVERHLLRRAIKAARVRGALLQRVLIAGAPAYVDEIAGVLARESWLGYQVIGAVTPAESVETTTGGGIRILGNLDDIHASVREAAADIVFFAGGGHTSAAEMRQIVWTLEEQDVQLVVAPSVTDISSERIRIRPVGGLPLIHLDPPTWSDAARLGKRAFDLLGSLLILVAVSPLFAIAALRVRLHDGGPVLYRQTRIGRQGEEFACLKFRTMVVDADDRIAAMQAEEGRSALLFKAKDDPRITTPGQWLRRYSVDELPQLINVLRGEMSLVGPRPQVQREVELYDDAMSRRLRVRPGMTGLWQVSGRNDLTIEEAIRLDLYYVDNWSMLQDLAILGRTVSAVSGGRGAY